MSDGPSQVDRFADVTDAPLATVRDWVGQNGETAALAAVDHNTMRPRQTSWTSAGRPRPFANSDVSMRISPFPRVPRQRPGPRTRPDRRRAEDNRQDACIRVQQ